MRARLLTCPICLRDDVARWHKGLKLPPHTLPTSERQCSGTGKRGRRTRPN